jgi:hypothetical protein
MYQGRFDPSECQRPRHELSTSGGSVAASAFGRSGTVTHAFATGFGGGGRLVFVAPGT